MRTKREWCEELGREIEVRDEEYFFLGDPSKMRVGDDALITPMQDTVRRYRHVRLLRVNGKLRLVEIRPVVRLFNPLVTADELARKMAEVTRPLLLERLYGRKRK